MSGNRIGRLTVANTATNRRLASPTGKPRISAKAAPWATSLFLGAEAVAVSGLVPAPGPLVFHLVAIAAVAVGLLSPGWRKGVESEGE